MIDPSDVGGSLGFATTCRAVSNSPGATQHPVPCAETLGISIRATSRRPGTHGRYQSRADVGYHASMSGAGQHYQRYMQSQTGKYATWQLGSKIELGDVGLLHAGEFRCETNLARLGIPFTAEEGGKTDESHASASWSSIGGGAELSTKGPRAVAKLEFARAGSVIFQARDLQQFRIADFHAVAKRIREHEEWQRDWMVVDQVWHSSRVAICVAVTDSAQAKVIAHDGGALKNLSMLAEASLGFDIEVASGQISVIKSGTPVQPLYTCRKRNWFGKVVPVSTRTSSEDELEAEWAECDLTDLVRSYVV
jgi:hypothetical protein